MSIQRYYKTDNAEILAAVRKYYADEAVLRAAGAKFGKHFGGKPIFSNGVTSIHFHGLRFSPEKPRELWIVPDPNSGSVQWPRDRLKSPINKDLKAPHKALKEEWAAKYQEHFPEKNHWVHKDEMHAAIGYNSGMAMLCGDSFLVFEQEGTAWITTRRELNAELVEITGSEFEAARTAAKEIREAA